jgi:hypothetical protein
MKVKAAEYTTSRTKNAVVVFRTFTLFVYSRKQQTAVICTPDYLQLIV